MKKFICITLLSLIGVVLISFTNNLKARIYTIYSYLDNSRYTTSITQRINESSNISCTTNYYSINLKSKAKKSLLNELINTQADSGLIMIIDQTGEIVTQSSLVLSGDTYKNGDTNVFNQPRYIGGLIYPFPMMIALKDKVLIPSDTVDVGNGTYIYKGARMTDHNYENGGYGVLTARQVFGYDSNIGMAKLILKGYEDQQMKFVSSMIDLGFKIDTANWSATSLPWLTIGYETMISPVDLIHLYGDIANNRIKGYENVIPDIQNMMRFCVEEGTGKNIDSDYMEIAGKTSTIITSKEQEVSFCGYFSIDNSIYTCLVIISNPKNGYPSGGIMAGNVIKEITNKLNK